MGTIIYRHLKTTIISRYHNWTYLSGLLYFVIAPEALILLSNN